MAVTVQQMPFVVLDEEYTIVEVGRSAEGGFGPLAGQNIWACFPGAERLFRPYYDKAWRTGAPEEFVQFYSGYVTWVRAEPQGDRLKVSWKELHTIDALTVSRLQESLGRAIDLVDAEQAGALRQKTRTALRLVEEEA